MPRGELLPLLGPEQEATELSARIFGFVWAAGAASSWLTLAVPGLPVGEREVILVAAVVTSVMALVSLVLARRATAARLVAPLSLLLGLPFGAAVIAFTGGAQSAGRLVLVMPVVFTAWAFRPAAAAAWGLACIAAYAAPLAYTTGEVRARFQAELLVLLPSCLALAAGVVVTKRVLVRLRQRAERLAAEQGALRRVATRATEAVQPEEVHAVVAEEAARLLGAPAAAVLRVEDEGVTVTGLWEGDAASTLCIGQRLPGGLEHLEARDRLAAQASTDHLMGVANRRAFHERAQAEVRRARRHGQGLSLAVIDCDHFKAVNDHAGHAAGDTLLARVAAALREAARGEDLVARVGGDEFAWLLSATPLDGARAAVGRVCDGLARHDEPVSGSAGVAELRDHEDREGLFRRADAALYAAKAAGRGTIRADDAEVAQG